MSRRNKADWFLALLIVPVALLSVCAIYELAREEELPQEKVIDLDSLRNAMNDSTRWATD